MTTNTNATGRPDIGDDWYAALRNEFDAPYFAALKEFLI